MPNEKYRNLQNSVRDPSAQLTNAHLITEFALDDASKSIVRTLSISC